MKKALVIITGILTAILGIYAFCVPFRTFLSLGWLLGALLLVNGIELVFMSKKDVWQIILGILTAVGGGIILFNGAQRVLTDVMLAYLAGGCVIVYGVSAIARGVGVMKESKGAGILGIICGILSILAGIFAVGHPVLTMISVGYIIAFNIIMQGVNMVILGIVVKAPAKEA